MAEEAITEIVFNQPMAYRNIGVELLAGIICDQALK
jgi:hypothetical protein